MRIRSAALAVAAVAGAASLSSPAAAAEAQPGGLLVTAPKALQDVKDPLVGDIEADQLKETVLGTGKGVLEARDALGRAANPLHK